MSRRRPIVRKSDMIVLKFRIDCPACRRESDLESVHAPSDHLRPYREGGGPAFYCPNCGVQCDLSPSFLAAVGWD